MRYDLDMPEDGARKMFLVTILIYFVMKVRYEFKTQIEAGRFFARMELRD